MAISQHIERFVRSRLVRLALALILVSVSGWAFLPYLSYRIAPSAFVNAELVRVIAPIAGRLAQKLPRKGDFIEHNSVTSFRIALVPIAAISLIFDRQHAMAKERAELAHTQLEEIRASDVMLAGRMDTYRAGMIKRISHEIDELRPKDRLPGRSPSATRHRIADGTARQDRHSLANPDGRSARVAGGDHRHM